MGQKKEIFLYSLNLNLLKLKMIDYVGLYMVNQGEEIKTPINKTKDTECLFEEEFGLYTFNTDR